jgi:hypoxanthine phosphoribosyltransferase
MRVVLSEREIQERVLQLGATISTDYAGRDLVLVGVLKGAVIFLADLVRAIRIPLTFDFVGVSSYGSGATSSGRPVVTKDVKMDLAGRDVLLVEDILDTGATLRFLFDLLRAHGPASLEACCFLAKDLPRPPESPAVRYVGFRVPAEFFVVGYGLDHDEHYRELRHVAALD